MDATVICEHLLVIDLEATCDDQGRVPKGEMEVIEIGAVMVRRETLQPISEYQAFVRPIRHPELTDFCTKLTSIQQRDVDSALPLPEVIRVLKRWLYGFSDVIASSWGDYDHHQLVQDCRLHGIAYPLPGRHVNLKVLFSAARGATKKFGMAEAMKLAGLPLLGVHHRGIDDARNIAKLLPFCLQQ
jgi:inhibitor of KinA sporulation pathway (predicted exonuclease)